MNGKEFTDLSERMARVEEKCKNIEVDLKWIVKKLEHYRPPWVVVALITFLTSACTALMIIAFRQ